MSSLSEPGFHLAGWYFYRRLMLNFFVDPEGLAARLPVGWRPVDRLGGSNVTLGLCEVLLHVDANGEPVSTPSYCYGPLNGSAKDEVSGEMVNMRYLTLTSRREDSSGCLTRIVEGRHESELRVAPDQRVVVREQYKFASPEVRITVDVEYQRPQPVLRRLEPPGMRVRCPDDPRFLAYYLNEELQEVVYMESEGIDLRHRFECTVEIDELASMFVGTERLVSLIAVPISRREIWLAGGSS